MTKLSWSYGLTTCKRRVKDPKLLIRTIESLSSAGFGEPIVFADETDPEDIPEELDHLEWNCRGVHLRTFANFCLGLMEIYMRSPRADRFAMFQDDFITYRNLRDYLEAVPYPQKGYLNLYTFPENEKDLDGWYFSNQQGLGAVALVFDNATVRALLSSEHMMNRPLDKNRGWRAIDGGIVTGLKHKGIKEYVHNPSLVQHTGTHSSMGNNTHAQATTFRGEHLNAMELLPQKQVPPVHTEGGKRNRIGLVGYNCRSGLGELNRQLATYVNVDTWLVVPHRRHKTCDAHPDVDTLVCNGRSQDKLNRFLQRCDTVIFCETEYVRGLTAKAKDAGKRVYCVPMLEWMTAGCKGWPKQLDGLICPTRHSYDSFAHVVPCYHFPWPVDVQRFKFVERTICNRFLFLNGHGGVANRKGGDVVQQLKELLPDLPLLVRSQTPLDWVDNKSRLPSVDSNSELYTQGDVLISPHSVDGLGLEPMEAMAAGMPVLTTDGMPWNEIPSLEKIKSTPKQTRAFRRPVTAYQPSASHLAELCLQWLNKPISDASQLARKWAEDNQWSDAKVAEFEALLAGSMKFSLTGA